MQYKYEEILSDLRESVIEVTFTKVNGERRIMRCTLMPKYLPATYTENVTEQANEKQFHANNNEVIRAWDVQSGGWRSFRIDSVEYLQVIDAYY